MLKRKLLSTLAAMLASAAIAGATVLPLVPSNPNFSDPAGIVATLNALVNQLNGLQGYGTAPQGVVSIGLGCQNAAAGGTPQVCNGQRGLVAYTGLGVTTTGTVMTTVVTDSAVTAASACSAWWQTAFTAGSGVAVATVVPTAGSLSVISVNAGTTANAVTTGTLGFNCVN